MDSAIDNVKRRQVAALQIAPLGGQYIFFRQAPYGGLMRADARGPRGLSATPTCRPGRTVKSHLATGY